MAKFKVGDRVVLNNNMGYASRPAGVYGTVFLADPDEFGNVGVTWDGEDHAVWAHEDRLDPASPSPASVQRNTTISIREGVIRVWDRGGKQVVRCPVALWPIVREAVRNAAAELDAATKEQP